MFLMFDLFSKWNEIEYLESTELRYDDDKEKVYIIDDCRLVLQSDDDDDAHFFKRFVISFICEDVLTKIVKQWKFRKKLPPYVSLKLLQANVMAVTDLKSGSVDGCWCVRKAVTLYVDTAVINNHKDDYDDDDDDIPTDMHFYFKFYVSRSLRDLSFCIDKEIAYADDYDRIKIAVYRKLFGELKQVFNTVEPKTKTVKRSDEYFGKPEIYFIDYTDEFWIWKG